MKLFILATLVAAATAARLENLERNYLPPEASQGSNNVVSSSSGQSSFGTNGQSASSQQEASASFAGATSNQYLPPNEGPSSSSNGIGNVAVSTFRPSSNGNGLGSQGAQYSQGEFGTPNRQYLGPQSSGPRSSTQQPFDEETGYHY